MTRTSHPVAVGRPVQPQLLGALHALNGLAIGAVTGWLLSETRRRRATASRGRASRGRASRGRASRGRASRGRASRSPA